MNKSPMMTKERAIIGITAIPGGFLLVNWDKGQMGLVDMRPIIETLPVFEFLRDDDAFKAVKVSDDGAAIYWTDCEGDVIDIDSASLWIRRKAIASAPAKGPLRASVNLAHG